MIFLGPPGGRLPPTAHTLRRATLIRRNRMGRASGKRSREGQRVNQRLSGLTIVTAPTPDLLESGGAVQEKGVVPVPHLKVKPARPGPSDGPVEPVDQGAPATATTHGRPRREQKKLSVVEDRSPERETRERSFMPREKQDGPGKTHHAHALRAGPRFPEARVEGVGHDPHHLVKIADAPLDDLAPAHAAAFGRASGARP